MVIVGEAELRFAKEEESLLEGKKNEGLSKI
jgi:hypothetical protein